jgi:hypothetical protein
MRSREQSIKVHLPLQFSSDLPEYPDTFSGFGKKIEQIAGKQGANSGQKKSGSSVKSREQSIEVHLPLQFSSGLPEYPDMFSRFCQKSSKLGANWGQTGGKKNPARL